MTICGAGEVQGISHKLLGCRSKGAKWISDVGISVNTRGRMHEGRIAPLSAVIFYPAVKCTKSVCMSHG